MDRLEEGQRVVFVLNRTVGTVKDYKHEREGYSYLVQFDNYGKQWIHQSYLKKEELYVWPKP